MEGVTAISRVEPVLIAHEVEFLTQSADLQRRAKTFLVFFAKVADYNHLTITCCGKN